MNMEVKALSKCFGQKTVLDQVNLQVGEGEMLCLLGPSGAGKTTLIRSIIGAVKPTGGEIIINGVRVPDRRLMYDVGYMPQEEGLYGDISARANLEFFGGLYGMRGSKLRQRCDELLSLLDLYADAEKMVSDYSGGMKKRLSLAVALLHDPRFLLLDEPTVGIDPVLRKTIWERFAQLKNEGRCLVISTHVMDEALKCERCALLYNGRIIYDDQTENLLKMTPNGSIEDLFFMAGEGK